MPPSDDMRTRCPECYTERSVTVIDDRGSKAEVKCNTCRTKFDVWT